MSEEKVKILEMVEQGKITAKEALELLGALDGDGVKLDKKEHGGTAKWIKVRVYEPKEDVKVNVNLPISLLSVGLKLGSKFSDDVKVHLEDLNIEEIIEQIKNGAEGKIVEIEKEDGTKVEVFVE